MGKRNEVQLAVKTTVKIREKLTFPLYVQPKLNGVRALVSYESLHDDNDMFTEGKQVVIKSSEGNRYVLPHISNALKDFFIANPNTILDGELYIHNEPLNRIIRRLPKTNVHGTVSSTSLPVEDLEFHIFDVKNDNLQYERVDELEDIEKAVKNINCVHVVSTQVVTSTAGLNRLETLLNIATKEGYEGIIMRYPFSYYTSGSKRIKVMLKWKKSVDTECEILDIISEGMKNGVYVLKFLLKNDLNDETFLCNVGDDDRNKGRWSNAVKEGVYVNRAVHIGELATVKFYERSGVKKVPFHANVIAIRNYE